MSILTEQNEVNLVAAIGSLEQLIPTDIGTALVIDDMVILLRKLLVQVRLFNDKKVMP